MGCSSGGAGVSTTPPKPEPAIQAEVYVDPSFEARHQKVIYKEMVEWSTATNGTVEWNLHDFQVDAVLDYNGPACRDVLIVMKAYSTLEIIRKIEESRPSTEGQYAVAYTMKTCQFSAMLVIMDRIEGDEAQFRIIVAHELGHFLGLPHIEQPRKSIMTPLIEDAAPCITALDTAAFCENHGCTASKMRPCRTN